MGILRHIDNYLYLRWDRAGRFPSWAAIIHPYIHFCPEMDDMLVTDIVSCYCDYIPEDIKQKERAKVYGKDHESDS